MVNVIHKVLNDMTTRAIKKAVVVYKALRESSNNKACNQPCKKCGHDDINRIFVQAGESIQWNSPHNRTSIDDCSFLIEEFPDFLTLTNEFGKDFKVRRDLIKHNCRMCQYKWVTRTEDMV